MIVQMIGHVLADTTVNIGRLCSCVCVHMGAFEVAHACLCLVAVRLSNVVMVVCLRGSAITCFCVYGGMQVWWVACVHMSMYT